MARRAACLRALADGSAQLGQFMKDAGNRDDLVVATKYSLKVQKRAGANYAGNSRKHFFEAIKASLKRLEVSTCLPPPLPG